VGPFARRLIALFGEHRHVERRVVCPGTQDAVIEIEPVHLGPNDVVVHLGVRRPPGGVERCEPLAVGRELAVLRGHGGGRVVGHAVHRFRLLKGTPRCEQRDQVVVTRRRGATASWRLGTGVRCPSGDRRTRRGGHESQE